LPRFYIRSAESTDLQRIVNFLRANGLPTVGVENCSSNFVIETDEKGVWYGIAGLELYGQSALLRSVAVDESSRGMGHGKVLVDAALSKARQNGACNVYLLTDNASKYFENLGFGSVDREDIDGAVKASPEFGVCVTAVAMRKTI
jgi:amino-acid N-acetyltransferase